eukprot:763528-Hanusia_phi.AAC.3
MGNSSRHSTTLAASNDCQTLTSPAIAREGSSVSSKAPLGTFYACYTSKDELPNLQLVVVVVCQLLDQVQLDKYLTFSAQVQLDSCLDFLSHLVNIEVLLSEKEEAIAEAQKEGGREGGKMGKWENTRMRGSSEREGGRKEWAGRHGERK